MRKLTHGEISENRQKIGEVNPDTRMPVCVILDNIRSSYNVGSMFRTSDGAMVEKLYLTGFTPIPPQRDILKTALGATESIPWEYHPSAVEVVRKLKSDGIRVAALELTTHSVPYYEVNESWFPLCIVLGNEITGVSDELIAECDFSIEIPQFGVKQSLNVAVACGIALFELRKFILTKG